MKTVVWKKGIINTLAATGGNIGVKAASGGLKKMAYIASNDTSNHAGSPYTIVTAPVCVLPPIPYGDVTLIEKIVSTAEVKQVAVLGIDTETIVASTRYKLIIGNSAERYEGAAKGDTVYAYTSPAVLSGTAQTDRDNVYTVLVDKINNRSNHVTAFLMYKVAFTAGTSTGDAAKNFTPGDTVTQQTSGATAQVAACVITSGTFAADNAAGTIYLYNITGTWSAASKTLTATSTTEICTTNAALVIQGLVVEDDAGYYPSNPSVRRGPSLCMAVEGFSAAHFDIGVATATTYATVIGMAGVVSNGIGSRMYNDLPYMNADKTDYSQGDPAFYLNAAPVTTKTYTQYNIHVTTPSGMDTVGGSEYGVDKIYVLYCDESDGTNLTNFETALAAATGVTPA